MGWAAVQVDLLPLAQGTAEHLATYAHMDVSLDPFPYAGTTTTCESLYMGAPSAGRNVPCMTRGAAACRHGWLLVLCRRRAPDSPVAGQEGERVVAGLQGCRA